MKRRSKLKKLVDQSGPLIALLIMCTFLAIVSPKFLTINNLMKIIEQSTINGLISLGLFMEY
jgi:ribose transport system permease protein